MDSLHDITGEVTEHPEEIGFWRLLKNLAIAKLHVCFTLGAFQEILEKGGPIDVAAVA